LARMMSFLQRAVYIKKFMILSIKSQERRRNHGSEEKI